WGHVSIFKLNVNKLRHVPENYFQAMPEQQSIYLAAGEALMAGYTGTTFNVYYVLSTICLLLFAYTILKSQKFKKSVGLWGLISGFFMIVPSSAGILDMVFSLLSLIPWVEQVIKGNTDYSYNL
ncbi:MAG: hypothetical protein ACOWWR_04915, partial [Eubacteriales bacterium]